MHDAKDNLIVGLGSTGLSVARYLRARGQAFAVADTRQDPPGLKDLKALGGEVSMLLGPFDAASFSQYRRLIVSPGISIQEPAIAQAAQAGAEILGDIELFARAASAPVVAITGSNGKSTVTSLLGHMAAASGRRVGVGGNLGPPALDLLTDPEPDLYVLELSSFQLETTGSLKCAAAAVLNLAEDHLDRYADMRAYAAAKQRIFRGAELAIINRDDPWVVAMPGGKQRVSFGLDAPSAGDLGLRHIAGEDWLSVGDQAVMAVSRLQMAGRHNQANALAALALARAAGLPMEPCIEALATYTGLPHRCQFVGRYRGVDWYNDSKGTNLGSTLAALAGLPGSVVLIAGGQGKGQDFSALRPLVADKARGVVLLGQDAGRIAQAIGDAAPVVRVGDMEQAVTEAARMARRNDSVLLSPACASLDMYRNYEHRGEVFTSAVRRLGA